jgi:hypothetical protein
VILILDDACMSNSIYRYSQLELSSNHGADADLFEEEGECVRGVRYYRNIGILRYQVEQYYIAICFFNTGIYDMQTGSAK